MKTNKLVITPDIKERWKRKNKGNFVEAWTLRESLNVVTVAQTSPVEEGTVNGSLRLTFPEHADTNNFPFDNKHTLPRTQINYWTKLHLPC